MEDKYKKFIKIFNNIIKKIIEGETLHKVIWEQDNDNNDIDNDLKDTIVNLNQFVDEYIEANELAKNIANGNLDFEISKNTKLFISNSLKNLQSILKHITWKIKRITNGDFEQKIDFMGELSSEFNIMTERLKYYFFKIEEQNKELRNMKKILEETNAMKDRFFSIISHDLKNPFTAILGFSRFIFDNFYNIDKDHLKEIVEMIYNSSKNIFSLLENLLLWSRSQSGVIKYEPGYFDIEGIIRENLEILNSNILQKRINLELKIDNKDSPVFVDYNMISTAIRNLLSNAIKFTNYDGKIEINTTKDDKYLVIEIKDNGIGIEEENIPRLFSIDRRISTLGTNKEKGSGLGLIICKEFIQKNKGEIYVNSKKGVGTSFFVKLPLFKEDN